MNAAIRGACPGIDTPMPTGDGLLARLVLSQPVSIATFEKLCSAAAEYGNGILEVTQRGSLQIRGLSAASSSAFASTLAALGLRNDRPALLSSPLCGIDAEDSSDSDGLVSLLRQALSRNPPPDCLSPKVSVLIDGGGRLHLDAVPADIRLRAIPGYRLELAIGGDASSATPLGAVARDGVVPVVQALLGAIAALGERGRARDLGPAGARLSVHLLAPPDNSWTASSRPTAEPIGVHPLRDGTVACGFGLAFGYSTSSELRQLLRAAADLGATAIRPAPGRALLAIGLSPDVTKELHAAGEVAGLVIDPRDPRRYVVACAGSPSCASATLPTRQLAPQVAHALQSWVSVDKVVHLSGCSKGCAHPGPAALTIVGPRHFMFGSRASDAPHGVISPDNLVTDVKRLCTENKNG